MRRVKSEASTEHNFYQTSLIPFGIRVGDDDSSWGRKTNVPVIIYPFLKRREQQPELRFKHLQSAQHSYNKQI